MRKFLIWGTPAVLALAGACHDFDAARLPVARGTLGEEVYGIFCDRFAAGLLHEDMTGRSYRDVCHRNATGGYADGVDESKIQGPQEGLRDKDGNLISRDDQINARSRAIARLSALSRRREELITALDAIFPDVDIPVADTKNPDPTKTCDAKPGDDGVRRLALELADMLGRMTDVYNDDTMPAVTRSVARVLDFFKKTPEAQASVAKFVGREGYRPPDIDIGISRPIFGYPRFRDFAAETLRLASFDSDPYAPDAVQNGVRERKPGAAYPSFSKLLSVAHEELRTSKRSDIPPLSFTHDNDIDLDRLSRPRENLELATELFFVQDPAFGGSASSGPTYIAKRDRRGFAALAGRLEAPFVDKDGDALPDLDALGRFVTVDGKGAPTPFFVAGGPKVQRDAFGRAQITNLPIYDSVDVNHNLGAQLLTDLHPLVDPDHDVVMNAVAGAMVSFGKRVKASKSYDADPGRVDQWKLTHGPDQPPPADLASKPVSISFDKFDGATSPTVDLVYAFGQVLGERGTDDLLALTKKLFVEHPTELASVIGDIIAFKNAANKHAEAQLKDKSLFWDEIIDVAAEITQDRALSEDILNNLAEPDAALLGDSIAGMMQFKDHISYDRNDINGGPMDVDVKAKVSPKVPVDRGQPDVGWNRSQFQRLAQMVNDADDVTLCNIPNAIVHARGVAIAGAIDLPLAGTYAECEVLKVDNLAKFYMGAIVGKSKFYFRPAILREGVVGVGASTVDTIQQSAALTGFWDPPDARVFRPKPALLNRMVFFDQKNDSPLLGPNMITNRFLRDLLGPTIGNAVCPDRTIDDPVPDAADAAPDGKVRHLRSCATTSDGLAERNPDALFVLENFSAYQALTPLIKPFAAHDREDLLIRLFSTVHHHYQKSVQPTDCELKDNKSKRYCSGGNITSYEPLLIEGLPRLMKSLQKLSAVVQNTTINHCTQLDARTRECKATQPINGTSIMADLAEALVNVDRAREAKLKDRNGVQTARRNDGSTNPQVTPIYLIVQALSAIDDAFAASPDKDRVTKWRGARSAIVDQLFTVKGTGDDARFANPILPKIAPKLIDSLRAQLYAHCPDSFAPPYNRCGWTRDDLAHKLEETLASPTFVSTLDVLDTIRQDERARRELDALLFYLTDPASKGEALASTRAALTDAMQLLRDDDDLVPFYHIVAEAVAASVRDDDGYVAQTGLADALTSLLSRLAARERDENGANICSRVVDPNQTITIMLKNFVSNMKTDSGALGRTPFDVLIDVIGDVNRADPEQEGRLSPEDLAAAANEVSDFLGNKERGLEQFYQIIKNGTQ